jgi:hypothetical protein
MMNHDPCWTEVRAPGVMENLLPEPKKRSPGFLNPGPLIA